MMKFSVLVAASTALTLLAAPANGEEPPEGETRLAQLLEGRVAGEPERCVRLTGHDRLTIIDATAIVAKRGDTVWVSRPANSVSLDADERMELRRRSQTHVCADDRLDSFRRIRAFPNSEFNLYNREFVMEEFVPYRPVG